MADRPYLLRTIDHDDRWNPVAGKTVATFETPEEAAHELLRRGDMTQLRVMRIHPTTGKPYWLARGEDEMRVQRILFADPPRVPA